MNILFNILLFCIIWLPNLRAQKQDNNENETVKLYAKIFEDQLKNGLLHMPKGMATNSSLLKHFSTIVKPSGFKNIDSLFKSCNWSYLRNVNLEKFLSKDKQIKPSKLLAFFDIKPKKIKTNNYFCALSPVIFSSDMTSACLIVERSNSAVMVYFYRKNINWKLVKAETLLLF